MTLTLALFFVRDRRDLTEALDVTPAYLRTKEADSGAVIDYRNWQLALGRRFRSVKLWFVMRGYGIEGLQAHLRNGIDLCRDLTAEVAKDAKFEIVAPPRLGLLCFRLKREGASATELDGLNVELNSRLAARPDVHLTQTILKSEDGGEIFCIRFAIGALRTTKQDVEDVWAEVVKESDALLLEGVKN
jgi:aromatic-L-amino-acid decarboxylase